MNSRTRELQGIFLLFIIYLLTLLGYIFTRGFYSFAGVFILAFSFLLLFVHFMRPAIFRSISKGGESVFFLIFIAVISVSLSFVLYGGLYQDVRIFVDLSRWVMVACLAITLSYIASKEKMGKILKLLLSFRFPLLLLGALLLRMFMIFSSPAPKIDVFYFMLYGAKYFLSGLNPYSQNYPQVYSNVVPDYFAYFPGSFILTAPFVFVFSDPRYTFVAAEFLVVFCLYLILRKTRIKNFNTGLAIQMVSIIFLFNPVSLFVLEQSYMESLILLGVALFLLFIISETKPFAFFLLGILLTVKQYALLFLIPTLKLRNISNNLILLSLLVGSAIILPFFLWSPIDFTRDAIFYQINLPPRLEGLSLNSFITRYSGFDLSGVLVVFTLIFLAVVFMLPKFNLARFLQATTLLVFAFFLFNKWAFVNYYYLVSSLILFNIVLLYRSADNTKW